MEGAAPHAKTAEDADESRQGATETTIEHKVIREQVERILASRYFRNSKRASSLLRYSVERSLQGSQEHLKERTVGIDVFGRKPDYDTNIDPVVRMAAVEVRKRLGQYYDETGHESEICISLPPGSYVPEFRIPFIATVPSVEPANDPLPAATGHLAITRPRRTPAFLILVGGALALSTVLASIRLPHKTALDRFWEPVLNSPGSILLSVPVPPPMPARSALGSSPHGDFANSGLTAIELIRSDRVNFSDTLTFANVVAFMSVRGRPFHVRRAIGTNLQDLRDGPVVLIGAFSNGWTLRLTDDLRFSFARDAELHYIRDRAHPLSRKWGHRPSEPVADIKEDYAIITRVQEPLTGHFVVTAAGLFSFGAAAVGEFLTEPSYMESSLRLAQKDWDQKNIQIVIATKVIGGNFSPPRVLDVFVW